MAQQERRGRLERLEQTELQEQVVQRQHSEHSELLERKAHLVKLEERLRLEPLAHLERRVLMALLARLVQRALPAVLLRSELMEPKAHERQEQVVLQEHLAPGELRRREKSERLGLTELRVRMGRPAGQEVREPKIVVARCLPRVGFHREDCRS